MHKPASDSFSVILFSFGYKYGAPRDVNLLCDVRFLANPFHVSELRSFNGLEKKISDFVLKNDAGEECLAELQRMAQFMGKQLQQSGKRELRIGIGCTGGHHRSVAVVEALTSLLRDDFPGVGRFHRDISKESH